MLTAVSESASHVHHAAATLAWGKLDRCSVDRGQATRLSLIAHSVDVAAVVHALLAEPTIRRRLETLAGRVLDRVDFQRLQVIAFLHDVGKCSAGFYSKCLSADDQQAWMAKSGVTRAGLGHTRVVRVLFAPGGPGPQGERLHALGDAVWVDDIIEWHGDALADDGPVLWFAAISHHGLPINIQDLRAHPLETPSQVWMTPVAGYVPLDGLRRLGAAARALFPGAWEMSGPPLPAAPAFTHAFAGLVSLADWIGSNAEDGFFPYDLAAQDESRWPVAAARAAEVLRCMRIDQREARADLAGRAPAFEAVFPFPPKPAQVACGASDLGPIVVLESETGSGKTEAALWRFKVLFEAGQVDSLAFLLPTRVSATAIHKRVTGFMAKLFPNPALRPPVVLAVPGYMRVDGFDAAKVLPDFNVLWPDDVQADARPKFWAAENSKRYFSSAAAVGTIDQLLLSALEVKHSHMRASALLRSLIVVDEVHASDAYMGQLLTVALERHASAGGHALLLSATLCGEVRGQLVQAGIQAGAQHALSASDAAALSDGSAPYPCLTDIRGSRALGAAADALPQKSVRVRLVPALQDADAVAALVADAVRAGAKVLVIRNTVRLALETQHALERRLGADHPAFFRCNGIVGMHHGRYSGADRRLLDAQVEAAFGRESASASAPVVLVGTQTLEISLDCDADLLVTDLCPMDVMLQRIGRLHRHPDQRDAYRPAGYKKPHLVVLQPSNRNLGTLLGRHPRAPGLGIGPRSAYENLIAIEATLQQLESRAVLTIPADNRELVEACTDSGTLRVLAEALPGPWVEHVDGLFGKHAAQAGQAWRRSIRWTTPWSALSSADSLEGPARTRLGLDGRKFVFGKTWTSPFGASMTEVTVPGWMLPEGDLPDGVEDLEPSEAPSERGLRFTVGGRRFVYNRLGLAPEPRTCATP
jgi:CRISPR-associated endonuclease/helicase Cas3